MILQTVAYIGLFDRKAMDLNNCKQQPRNCNRPRLTQTPAPHEPWQSTTQATYTPPRNDLLKREGK